jgi:hypothetical protein
MAALCDLEKIQYVVNYPLIHKLESKQNSLTDYFDQKIYYEAQNMAQYYTIFYCLERSVRDIVVEKLKAIHGGNWWETKVPETIQKNVKENMQRELDAGVSIRSDQEIDYTTFGELGEIVKANWADFGDIFKSVKAFTKIMTSLNILRGPIAHCCSLSEDEVDRLNLVVRDWMRIQSK